MSSLRSCLVLSLIATLLASGGCDKHRSKRYDQDRQSSPSRRSRSDRDRNDYRGHSDRPNVKRLSNGNYLVTLDRDTLVAVDRHGRAKKNPNLSRSQMRRAEKAVDEYRNRDSSRPRRSDHDRDRNDSHAFDHYPVVNRLSNGTYMVTLDRGKVAAVNKHGHAMANPGLSSAEKREAERAVRHYDRHD